MSLRLPHEITISAPVAKVWEFLIDSKNYVILNPKCVENGPATVTPATDDAPEKREWTAVEAITLLGGLYTRKVILPIKATLTEPGKLVVHDINSSAGIFVHIEYAIEEVKQEGGGVQTLLKDTITITAPWYIRSFAAGTARTTQKTRSQAVKDVLEAN